MWYNSYAIYGARERLILLRPNLNNSSVSLFKFLGSFYNHNHPDGNLFI
jgi:hypothetical protein